MGQRVITWNAWEGGGCGRRRRHDVASLVPDVDADEVCGGAQSCQALITFRFDSEGKPRAARRRRLCGLDLSEEEADWFALRVEHIDDEVDGRILPAKRSRLKQRTSVPPADGAGEMQSRQELPQVPRIDLWLGEPFPRR